MNVIYVSEHSVADEQHVGQTTLASVVLYAYPATSAPIQLPVRLSSYQCAYPATSAPIQLPVRLSSYQCAYPATSAAPYYRIGYSQTPSQSTHRHRHSPLTVHSLFLSNLLARVDCRTEETCALANHIGKYLLLQYEGYAK